MRATELNAGDRYGLLVVISEARTPGGRRAALCRCDCGEEKLADLAHLRTGHTRSCGCVRRETAAEMARTNPLLDSYRHSELRREQSRSIATKHGVARHPHYDRWHLMMARCYNPDSDSFPNYGGRGIQVCADWHDPKAFCMWIDANLGACPDGWSIDRIDNNGNYEPGNVRWADPLTQSQNRRPGSEWKRRDASR